MNDENKIEPRKLHKPARDQEEMSRDALVTYTEEAGGGAGGGGGGSPTTPAPFTGN